MTIDELLEQAEIRELLYRYCRGIDRRDYDLVRSCYHDGATDDHGPFTGDVDGFIDYIRSELPRFERTMHSISNVLIALEGDDLTGRAARSEAYTIAFHRLRPSSSKPERDFIVGLRYVDRLAKRDGVWGITDRACIFEWARMDPTNGTFDFGANYRMGQPYPDDVVYD
jgi:hypothetical protein